MDWGGPIANKKKIEMENKQIDHKILALNKPVLTGVVRAMGSGRRRMSMLLVVIVRLACTPYPVTAVSFWRAAAAVQPLIVHPAPPSLLRINFILCKS